MTTTNTSTRRRGKRKATKPGKRPTGSVRRLPSGGYQARVTVYDEHTRDKHVEVVKPPLPWKSWPSEELAREAIDRWLADYRAGNLPSIVLGNTTFGKVAELWFARLRTTGKLRERTIEGYERLYDRGIAATFAQVAVSQVTGRVIRAWAERLTARGLCHDTVARHYTVVRGVLREAVSREMLLRLPHVELDEVTRASAFKPATPITLAQLDALAAALAADQARRERERVENPWRKGGPDHRGHNLSLMVRTMVLCGGQRKGECEALRVGDLDTTRWTLRIDKALDSAGREGKPKTDAGERTAAVPEVLRAELAAHVAGREPGERLWTSVEGCRMNLNNLRRRELPRALAAVGLPHMRLHDLRHSSGSLLAALAVPLTDIAHHLGHRDPQFTMRRYVHPLADSRDRVAAAFDAAIEGSVVPLRKAVGQ